jgi:hypothetical protein
MNKTIVMSIGVYMRCVDKQDSDAEKRTFSELLKRLNEENGKPPLQYEYTEGSWIIQLEELQSVDDLADKLLKSCADQNRTCAEQEQYRLLIGVDGGSLGAAVKAHELVKALRDQTNTRSRENQTPSSQVLITDWVYKQLSWKQQDLYGPTEDVKGTAVNRRFPADAFQCFVISPIGEEDSDVRRRADYIFRTYVKQACDGTDYRAVRGDSMTGPVVMRDVTEALQTAPMVVAYLGGNESNWNANVMYEIGYRLATGLPLVFLRESAPEGKVDLPLPFNLKDQRMVPLPPEGPDEKRSPENKTATKVTTIRKHISEAGASLWAYPHPRGSIAIYWNDQSKTRFFEASQDLEDLFEFRNIVGAELPKVVTHLKNKMPLSQQEPFMEEQNVLISKLNTPFDPLQNKALKDIIATVPIVFQSHRTCRGKAFLPVIVSYAKSTDVLKIRIVYLDVTAATKKEGDHFVCLLKNGELLDGSTQA